MNFIVKQIKLLTASRGFQSCRHLRLDNLSLMKQLYSTELKQRIRRDPTYLPLGPDRWIYGSLNHCLR